jgi:hypothetical protein
VGELDLDRGPAGLANARCRTGTTTQSPTSM